LGAGRAFEVSVDEHDLIVDYKGFAEWLSWERRRY